MNKEKLIILVVCASLYGILALGFLLGLNESITYRAIALSYFFFSTLISIRWIYKFDLGTSIFLTPLFSTLPIMIIGSMLYLISGLYQWTFCLLLALPLASLLCMPRKDDIFHFRFSFPHISLLPVLLLAVFLLLEAASLTLLSRSSATLAVLGPWSVVSPSFFVLFFSSSLLLFPLFSRLPNALSLLCSSLHFFTAFSVVTFVFPLGFGFDPHLHRATEELIVQQGVVTPKTFYYAGQYVLVGFLSKLLQADVHFIDKMLLPLLAATALPALAASALRTHFSLPNSWSLIGALLLLLFPFSYAISTTPWALAFLFGICVSFGSLCHFGQKSKAGMALCALFSAAAMTVHPLAGLPLFGACSILFFRGIWRWLVAIFFAVSIPLALLANAAISSQFSVAPYLNTDLFASLYKHISLSIGTRFHVLLDPVYFFHENYLTLFIILGFIGMYITKKYAQRSILFHATGIGIVLANALVISLFFSFPELISYEQHEYASRLVQLSLVFLLPFFLFAVVRLLQKSVSSHHATLASASMIVCAGLLTASLYVTYPRNDAFASFHGYSVSQADIDAVRFIDEDANEIPYIVLANQVVAAAAVKEFGFKKYYTVAHSGTSTELFYYPIPTSSPLHTSYRDMLENPDTHIVQDAAKMFDVQRVYFVVNAYEDRIKNIIDKAKKTANSFTSFHDKDFVFRYDID